MLRRLELDVTRRLDGLVSGDYLAFAHGTGSEPAGARAYGPGDDARRIDWCLTARPSTAQVRTTEADREMETWVIADRSPSLDFGTAEREKREVVLGAAAAFGFLGLRAGNRLGVIATGGDALLRIPARTGRVALLAALAALYDTPRREAAARPGRRPPRRLDASRAGPTPQRTDRRGLGLSRSVRVGRSPRPPGSAPPDHRRPGHRPEGDGPARRRHVDGDRCRDRAPAARPDQFGDPPRTVRGRGPPSATSASAGLIAESGAEHLQLSTDRDWLIDVARFVGRRRRARLPIQPVHSRAGTASMASTPSNPATTPKGDQ